MVIVQLAGGLGNQFSQYAVGRYLAHKLNTELKLDLIYTPIPSEFSPLGICSYRLGDFNIQENFATPEEIKYVQDNGMFPLSFSDLKDFQNDIFIQGHWMNYLDYQEDFVDILRKEFTLKNPSQCALAWQKKILAAECAVSMHFRYGDYLYDPSIKKEIWAGIPQLDYYYTCIEILKREYKNMTAFVFSDDIQWCKENLRLDIPTEFVSGNGTSNTEEFYLMSLCKHNINASSTFSSCAAVLNANPAKKCFSPLPKNAEVVQKTLDKIKIANLKPSDFDTWIFIPYDFNNQPDIDMRPWFSLLMVVNNDIDTLEESLNSILAQDYTYYEVIIIDNASFDGSGKICQQAAKISEKVTLIKLYNKISNGAAWNKALNIAQGNFVMFLKGDDRIFPDALTSLYPKINVVDNVACALTWFREDDNGSIEIADRKFSLKTDTILQDLKESTDRAAVISEILSGNKIISPLATKIFNINFLTDKAIRFDEQEADAELKFTTEAISRTSDKIRILSEPFYVAPKKN